MYLGGSKVYGRQRTRNGPMEGEITDFKTEVGGSQSTCDMKMEGGTLRVLRSI